ncbi:putative acyltransferase [Methanocella paludicola SANAE]|uniref:Acyltransferase n=1 Tax=Methanocella paludicola (strain DSM 17711 / JCM 13418 / NBRC 101707 / SANAE) TaxID=304371 RepID=D1YV43_METPS|nr:acyltransferase [Methanocella paludicola]BAI60315.1 putative acyltransferase [Methanocella paludicola SANAE]
MTVENDTHKSNNFDFLRVFAALLVIFSHSFPLSGIHTEPLGAITGYMTCGALGVAIFFIISGYLITKSWMEHPSAIRFLWNRSLRIFPGLFVVTIICILVLGPLVTNLSLSEYFAQAEYLWLYLKNTTLLSISFYLPGVFTNNPYQVAVNGSLWSLPIEFGMYLLILALGLLGLLRKKEFLLLLASCTIIVFAFNNIPELATIKPIVDLFDAISILGFLTSISTGIAIMFMIGAIYYLYKDSIVYNGWISLTLFVALCLSFKTNFFQLASLICLPYMIIWASQVPTRYIKNTGKYGDFSYGLYIYAFPVQQLIMNYFNGISWLELFILAVPATFICAFLSWHLIESNFLKLKKIDLQLLFETMIKKISPKIA